MANEPIPSLEVLPKENNNSTDPKANQTDPWYDRPKPVDKSVRAPEHDPKKVTGVGTVKK